MATPFILVVEDNPDHLELAVETFRDIGVRVPIEVARDGVEALDFLFARGAHAGRCAEHQPAFVMLDIKLPRLSGIDVLRHMRGNLLTACVPVIMLTSSTEHADMQACYEAGANSFVHKSFDFARYTAKLQCLQAYWLDVNQAMEHDSMFAPLTG